MHFIFISVKYGIFLFFVLLNLAYSNYVATGLLIL